MTVLARRTLSASRVGDPAAEAKFAGQRCSSAVSTRA
jgi:hypothetical protein